jgi:TPR repeat protein
MLNPLIRIVCAITLSLPTLANAGTIEDAFAAAKRGDFPTAFRLWQPLAMKGDASAQANLGYMYENGQGVPRDYQQAVMWYRKSAQQGHAKGQLNLGYMYEMGQGVPLDYPQAAEWYRKAAQQGHPQAQLNLGTMYYNGFGVQKDYVRAYMWEDVAAASLNGERGTNNLTLIAGPMTPEQIDADVKTATTNRALVGREMTAAQIERARKMASVCNSSNYKQCD